MLPWLQFMEKNAIAAKNPWPAEYSDQNITYHPHIRELPDDLLLGAVLFSIADQFHAL